MSGQVESSQEIEIQSQVREYGPDSEINIIVLYSLHVEANGRDGRHDLTQLELVEDRCLRKRSTSHK